MEEEPVMMVGLEKERILQGLEVLETQGKKYVKEGSRLQHAKCIR